MADVQWYHIVVPLVGGGAMGAIINAVVSAMRNRVQPVGKRVEVIPIFKETLGVSCLRTKITISDGQNEHKFDNLFVAPVQLINRGNQNIPEFQFGITLSENDVVIYVEPHSSDRHHILEQLTPVTLDKPVSEIDFALKPFNRGDAYSLDLFIVIPKGKDKPGPIQLSSPHSIRFVDMPSVSELAVDIIKGLSVSVGPMDISIGRKKL